MLLMCLNILNMFHLLIYKLLYIFFCTDLTILVQDKLMSKMGKSKKSVVREFFEQRAHLKACVTCAHLK